MFPDQDTAREFLEKKRWPDVIQCPFCQEVDRIGKRKGGYYRCNACMEVFTVRTKTVMERSHIPLHKWIYGMYLLVTARKGISSVRLAKEIGIRQSSAWFMLQRLREACKDPSDPLCGIVEIDEKPPLKAASRINMNRRSPSRSGAVTRGKPSSSACANTRRISEPRSMRTWINRGCSERAPARFT